MLFIHIFYRCYLITKYSYFSQWWIPSKMLTITITEFIVCWMCKVNCTVEHNKKYVCYDNLVNFWLPGPRTYYVHLQHPHLRDKIAIRFKDAAYYPNRVEPSRADPSPVGVARDYPKRCTARTHLFYEFSPLLQSSPTQCEAASLPLQEHLDPSDSILLDLARFG
jgi:hypothetical protein